MFNLLTFFDIMDLGIQRGIDSFCWLGVIGELD